MRAATQSLRRTLAVTAVAAVAASALAACSSSSDNGGGSNNSSSPNASSAFGAANKATDTPVTIGFISDGKSASIDVTDEIKGAQAAAEYANNYLGGLAGHEIKVETCQAQAVPAKATACANQMVSDNVAGVVEASFGEVDQSITVLSKAKIPLFIHAASTQLALSTPGVFNFTNALSYFGTPMADAKKQGLSSLDMVTIDVPAAAGPAKQLGPLLGSNIGLKVTVTTIPPGTADMTPQIAAANQSKPGDFMLFGDPTFCAGALKAVRTAAPNTPVSMIDRCIAPGAASSVPGGYNGVRVVTTSDLDPSRPDVKIFQAGLEKWGDGAKFGPTAASGWAPMLGMITALNAAKITDLTPAGLTAAIKSAPPTEYPLAGGIQFECNGKQIGISPNICASDGIMATADESGNLSDYERVTADPKLYSLPTGG